MRKTVIGLVLALVAVPPAWGQPAAAPANARFYADCLAASAADKTYDRDGRYVRFACYGAPAQAFFDRLAAFATPKGWERTADRRLYRFTGEIEKDESGSGLDRCWRMIAPSAGEPEYGCLLVFPAGAFLDG